MAFGKSVGLPGMWSAKTRTKTTMITIEGIPHKVKTRDMHWHGNFQGFNYWIDGNVKKYFCNLLTREEAIDKAIERIQKGQL